MHHLQERFALRALAVLAGLLLVVSFAGCACGPKCPAPDDAPAVALAASAPAAVPPPPPVRGEGPWNLTLFHINDTHTAFMPEPATWRDDHAPAGGIVALASHLEEQRRGAAASLLLDAGDFMTGNPVGEIEVDGVPGGGWIDMLNLLGIDAGTIGNHDFDQGRDNARRLAARAAWPIMALDLRDERGELVFAQEPVIFERGGLRVGVIGVTCSELFEVTADVRVAGLRLDDQRAVIRRWIAELDPKTDLLVLLTHDGLDVDQELARDLAGSGLDVIVGGHSHSRTREPRLVGGILVVQAGSHAKNLGRLDLRVADDRIVAYDGRLVEVLAEGRRADAALEALAESYAARVDAAFGQVIGRLARDWRRDGRGESNVGSWICDRLREAAGADVALLNSGTLRRDFLAGPVTLLDVHSLVPFNNTLETFRIDGAGLRGIVLANARTAEVGGEGILQVSGLRYAYAWADSTPEVLDLTVGGEPLDPARVYTVACPDFVVQKARIYMDMDPPASSYAGMTITDAIADAVRKAGVIDATTDGRITRR